MSLVYYNIISTSDRIDVGTYSYIKILWRWSIFVIYLFTLVFTKPIIVFGKIFFFYKSSTSIYKKKNVVVLSFYYFSMTANMQFQTPRFKAEYFLIF